MSIEQMRDKISSAYPGESWKIKVKKMPDSQILAVYRRMLENKIIH